MTPGPAQLDDCPGRVVERPICRQGDGVFATDRLGEIWRGCRRTSRPTSRPDILVISVSSEIPRTSSCGFRPELVETTASWAGGSGQKLQHQRTGRRSTEPAQVVRSLEGDGSRAMPRPGGLPTLMRPSTCVSRCCTWCCAESTPRRSNAGDRRRAISY